MSEYEVFIKVYVHMQHYFLKTRRELKISLDILMQNAIHIEMNVIFQTYKKIKFGNSQYINV